jgi:DNA-directed RNA polymerase specialized sigma24 family protein
MAELVAPGSSPEAAVRERQELLLAFSRLDALKPKKRVAFVLNVVEGLSLEEMARLLDTDARTLGQRVACAKRELAAMFERDARRARKPGGE